MVFAKSQQYTKVAQDAFPLPTYRKAKTSSIWRILQSFSLFGSNILVLLVNLLVVIGMWNQVQGVKSYCPEIPYTPAMKSVKYEKTPLDLVSATPFAGPKTRDMERAWETLQLNEIWRATGQELEKSGAMEAGKSLRLMHGGYMAIMRIYHELHCLNWIKREWDPMRPVMTDHLDHCLDGLKHGAMCKADLALGSFYWWPEEPAAREAVRRPNYERTCASWNSLQDFLNKRRMSFDDDGVPESPLDENGHPIIVVPTDSLHNQNKELTGGDMEHME